MAQIPSYDQWMKDTHSLTSPRSEYLKKLDEAIKTQNRDGIKTAFDRWRFEQSKQGKKWTESVRNKKGAATNLHRALSDVDRRKLTAEEIESMRWLSQQQALALQKMFMGKEVKFKANTLVGMATGAGTKWERFKAGVQAGKTGGSTLKGVYGNVSNVVKGAQVVQQGGKAAAQAAASGAMSDHFSTIRKAIADFCRELCPGVDPNHVFTTLNLGNVENFASNLAPFVGAISSGGKAIVGWIGVAKKAWDRSNIVDSRYAFAPGDPEAAFDAVLTMVDRELASESAKATASTVAFTGKLLGAFADAGAVTGPVIGLLETLAGIFQTIIEYVRDYKECQLAQQLLKLGALNLELFAICPILGCYFIVVQDHSTIISFAVADYGTENWILDVEALVKKINPVLSKARQYIHASRLEIPGMSHYKGVVEANYSHKHGLEKVTGLPNAVKEKLTGKIDAWFEKPEAAPKVDKTRIIGFGSDSLRVKV